MGTYLKMEVTENDFDFEEVFSERLVFSHDDCYSFIDYFSSLYGSKIDFILISQFSLKCNDMNFLTDDMNFLLKQIYSTLLDNFGLSFRFTLE